MVVTLGCFSVEVASVYYVFCFQVDHRRRGDRVIVVVQTIAPHESCGCSYELLDSEVSRCLCHEAFTFFDSDPASKECRDRFRFPGPWGTLINGERMFISPSNNVLLPIIEAIP